MLELQVEPEFGFIIKYYFGSQKIISSQLKLGLGSGP
jgi:hypothetical protein